MNPTFASWLRRAAALTMLALAALASSSFAQDASYVNPPTRVAQLNFFEGAVSFEPAGYGQWAAAVLNRPLTQGDKVWNAAGARSELHVGSTAMQLAGETSIAFTTLDDQSVQLALTQGSVIARVRELPASQHFEIDTPNLALTVSQPGDYRLDVDPVAGTTAVTVRAGSVQVLGSSGTPLTMSPVEQIVFSGNDLVQVGGQTAPLEDAFGYWAAARDAAEGRASAARHLPRDMTGWQQLDGYGTWQTDPTYGEVWVPTVTIVDWAPYRYGHWAYILPWGWTWIDDQPWGFAPFHYGRWAMLGPRWCWVPGPITVRPVYAPALVAFVGGSIGGVNFSISVGGAAQPAVGWFPLAPGEVWHPAFRASPTYVSEVNRTVIVNRNVTHITNIVNVNRVTNVYRFQNMPQAVTAVSANAFGQGQHLRGNPMPVSASDLAHARVVPPPAPTRDPRAIFAASRMTQPHPAPPAAAIERRVIVDPASAGERGAGAMPQRAMPGPAQPRVRLPSPRGPERERRNEVVREAPVNAAPRAAQRTPAAPIETPPRTQPAPEPLQPQPERRLAGPQRAVPQRSEPERPLPPPRQEQPPQREQAPRQERPQGPQGARDVTPAREQGRVRVDGARAAQRAEPGRVQAQRERGQPRSDEDRGAREP